MRNDVGVSIFNREFDFQLSFFSDGFGTLELECVSTELINVFVGEVGEELTVFDLNGLQDGEGEFFFANLSVRVNVIIVITGDGELQRLSFQIQSGYSRNCDGVFRD